MNKLMDSHGIDQAMKKLADAVRQDATTGGHWNDVVIVGIRSRGELIAQRLAAALQKDLPSGTTLPIGVLDITMYRDDLSERKAITIPRGTQMDFRLDGKRVILCDDVLETGRSIRAALDALVDFGRPRLIRLAVLVDRGRREFPIAADYIGLKVDAPRAEQKVIVNLKPTDEDDAVFLLDGQSERSSA